MQKMYRQKQHQPKNIWRKASGSYPWNSSNFVSPSERFKFIDDLVMNTVDVIDCEEEIEKAGIKFPEKQLLHTVYDSLKMIWKDHGPRSHLNVSIPWKILNTIQLFVQEITWQMYKILFAMMMKICVKKVLEVFNTKTVSSRRQDFRCVSVEI